MALTAPNNHASVSQFLWTWALRTSERSIVTVLVKHRVRRRRDPCEGRTGAAKKGSVLPSPLTSPAERRLKVERVPFTLSESMAERSVRDSRPRVASYAAWVASLLLAACAQDGVAPPPSGVGATGSTTVSTGTTSSGTTAAGGAGGGSLVGAGGNPGATTTSGAGGGGTGGATPDGGAGGSRPADGGAGTVAAGVRWVGRVDTSDSAGPRFGWTGTGFVARFSGTSVGVNLKNDNAYFFQPVIDGVKGTRYQATQGTAAQQIATGLASGPHTLELYREIEASYGVSQFLGITEGTLMAPPPAPGRLIEFVGDSITAGYGNLGNEPHPNGTNPTPCHFTYNTESAYMSFGAVTARALNADASMIAASGWGVYRSLSGDTNQVLPKVYANTLGYSAPPTWDFGVKPDVVVIDLGTNDFGPGDPGAMYTTALGAFVDTIRSKYPSAWIFCALGTMLANPQHDQAKAYIQSVVTSHGSDAGKVAFVDMGIQNVAIGTGCDFHPNAAEDQRMADVLVPAIKQKLGW